MYFTYDKEVYYDVWDLKKSALVYRVVYKTSKRKNGVPIKIGDKQMWVWPDYIQGKTMYCVLSSGEALEIFPSLEEDANPVVLKIKFKDNV